jgi:hypothetical protein
MNEKQLHQKMGNILLVLSGIMVAVNIATWVMYETLYIYGLSALVAFLGLGLYMKAKAQRLP